MSDNPCDMSMEDHGMSKVNERTRKQIIDECVMAVTACFNHYSDHKLEVCCFGGAVQIEVRRALDKTLPDQILIELWQEYANEYDTRVAEEEENEE